MSNTDIVTPRRSIIEMSSDEAKAFFLKHDSYCTLELPEYFRFDGILWDVDALLTTYCLRGLRQESPRNVEDVNYRILYSKDGRYAWRPLELIHPALYVSLVNKITDPRNWETITERFLEFGSNSNVRCLSLPKESLTNQSDLAAQIRSWWEEIEQQSIEFSLDYEFLLHTDITDCYSSIYTHSIAWSIHGIDVAKENRRNLTFVGNIVDGHIQDMQYGQTNGIPQGSQLMNFIAEIVLGFADLNLSEKIAKECIEDCKILRYRDDYRIFVNNPYDGERILKCLTETLIDLGMKLNSAKTKVSSDVIRSSIKEDKLEWILQRQWDRNPQKHLLIIHDFSVNYPNSGSLIRVLEDFHRRLTGMKSYSHPLPMISIIADIAYHNPRTYPYTAAILSKLISFLATDHERRDVIRKILNKFSLIPNTGHMEVWLQRISNHFNENITFREGLCRIVDQESEIIWNNEWISSGELLEAIDANRLIDFSILNGADPVIPIEEIEVFKSRYSYTISV